MLDDMEKTISMSQLAKNAERIAQDIESHKTVYRVRHRRGSAMVLMDWASYEQWLAVHDIVRRPNWLAEWRSTEDQVATHTGRYLDDVMKELGDGVAERDGRGSAKRATARRARKGPRGSRGTRKRAA